MIIRIKNKMPNLSQTNKIYLPNKQTHKKDESTANLINIKIFVVYLYRQPSLSLYS